MNTHTHKLYSTFKSMGIFVLNQFHFAFCWRSLKIRTTESCLLDVYNTEKRKQINTQITFYCFESKETIRRSAFIPFHGLLYACVFMYLFRTRCVFKCVCVLVWQYKNKCCRSFFWSFFLSFSVSRSLSNDYYGLIHPLAIRLQIRCLFDFETRDFGAFTTFHLIISNIRIYVYLWWDAPQPK